MNKTKLEHILFVEDDVDIQNIVRVSLSSIGGYLVTICSSAHEALLKLQKEIPQMIITDVMMPEMDGISLFKEIRKIPSLTKIPIIFMTAKVQPKEIESYNALGVSDVIIKPFDPIGLNEQIASIWERS